MDEFILALFGENDKLRMNTLYQILVGRKSASMLYYAYGHQLLDIVGIFPHLSKAEYEKIIQQLINQKALSIVGNELVRVQIQPFLLNQEPYCHLNHFRIKNSLSLWRMLQLFLCRLSYWPADYQGPVLENSPFYLLNVDQMIAQMDEEQKQKIYEELSHVFSQMPQDQADFLANTFSGKQISGKTFYQVLPEDLHSPFDICYTLACVERFWSYLMTHTELVLFQLFKPFILENYKQSMLVTRQYYKFGYDVEKIAQIRGLKEGTITDHLIEWAILDDKFPFEDFQLLTQVETLLDYRYKDLVEENPEISFLQYRLSQIAILKGRDNHE
ncbi:helix-turn-helix domain-containing protein [Enterococcus cecorum]|uniref:helix-turn-helix domain-containing protein n=1 Tax=Enterococcus cecorum TaxID=44008 RepID=UPI0032C478AA